MAYELIWEAHGVVKRFSGQVSSKEILQAGVDTEADGRFDGYRFVINDFLGCTKFDLSAVDIEEIAAIDEAAARYNRNIKVAVVTTAPEMIAAARQYATSEFNVYPTRIFATLAEARAWIAGAEGAAP